MFNNSKRIVSLILSLILILSFGAFSALATENTKLASLSISSGTLYPAFDPDVTSYTAVVDSLSSLPTITATLPEGSDASITLLTVQPSVANNYRGTVVVKEGEDVNAYKQYTVTVTTGDKVIPIESGESWTNNKKFGYDTIGGVIYFPTGAYDGNLLTVWNSKKTTAAEHKWTLTEAAEVSSVKFWVKGHNTATDMSGVYGNIEISENGTTWSKPENNFTVTRVGTAAFYYNQELAGANEYFSSYQVNFDPVVAKYIRLNVAANQEIYIREIQVLGSNDPKLNITTDKGTLYPEFSEDVTAYKVSVNSLSSLPTISATCSSLYEVTVTQASADNNYTATVTVNRNGVVVQTYTFEVTDAGLPLAITGYTNTANVYAITTGSRKAASAYDGDYATRWTLNVAADHTYDLGKPYALTSLFIVCANSAKSDQNSYVPINCLGAYGSLEFSIDGTTWYKASGWQGEAKMSNKSETINTPGGQSISVLRYINFEFDKETVARYFRFTGFEGWKFDVYEIVPVGKDASAVSLTNPNADGTGAQVYTTAAANGTAFCAYYDAEDNLLDIALTPFTASGAGAYTLTFSAAPTGTVSSRIYLLNVTTLVPLAINKTTASAVPNIE